jgi:hypothetical protein
MVSHMKTTIEIADALLRDIQELARTEQVTLRALTEEGLRHVLAARRRRPKYRFRPVVFQGDGLRPEFEGGGWDQLRSAIYEGRGE